MKGLQDRGVVNFKCANCDEHLLVLQLVAIEKNNKSEILTRVAVQCGFCDGFSYVQQIHGQFYPGAPNDQMVFDILDRAEVIMDTYGSEYENDPEVDVLFRAWSK